MNFTDIKNHALSGIFTAAAAFVGGAVVAAVPTLIYGGAQAIGLNSALSFVAAGVGAVVWSGGIIGAGVIFGAGAAALGGAIAVASGLDEYKWPSGILSGVAGFALGLNAMFGLAASDDTQKELELMREKLEQRVSISEEYERPNTETAFHYDPETQTATVNTPQLKLAA